MKDKEILKKAIEKVVKNGWRWKDFDEQSTLQIWNIYGCRNAIRRGDYYFVIFSHDFAKCYWGEKYTLCGNCQEKIYDYSINYCPKCKIPLLQSYTDEIMGWQGHQHKMLDYVQVGRNPLKYLEKFL